MEEITVQIHCEGKEKHEVSAPEDIVMEEFVTELVDGLRLPVTDDRGRALVWEADGNHGQPLRPDRTLRQNGVLSGHNLYLRSKLVAPPPEPLPPARPPIIPKPFSEVKPLAEPKPLPNVKPLHESKPLPHPPPVVPVRAKAQWPLWVAVALIPVAAAGSYLIAKSRSDEIARQLTVEKAAAQSARTRVADAELKAAQLQTQLDDLQHGTVSAQADLQSQLDAAQAQLKAMKASLAQITAERNQLRTQVVHDSEEHTSALAAVNQKLQAAQSQLAADQQSANSLQTRLAAALREVTRLKELSPKEPSVSEKAHARSGSLTWTGEAKSKIVINDNKPPKGSTLMGALPGTECTIEPAEPDRVTILVPPGPKNNWNGVTFQVKGKGETTVKLNWKLK